jgi:hypothetical protein
MQAQLARGQLGHMKMDDSISANHSVIRKAS